MFPTISHLIEYFTGVFIAMPIQTFGFMMAVSFFAAAYTLQLELKRKEQIGLIKEITRKEVHGNPATTSELIWGFIGGFILGFKLIEVIFHYQEFSNNPQEFILSSRGNWPAGIIVGVALAAYRYYEKKKSQLATPKEAIVKIMPHQMIGDITITAAISGLIGAKLFDSFENWSDFVRDPISSLFSFSGLTFYGGFIFGAIAVLYYASKLGIKYYHMIDAAAPGLMLAYAIGRSGCQLSGDGDWGIVNTSSKPSWMSFLPDWMWSFKFPHNVIGEGVPIPGCEGRFCYELAEGVYPTAFYEIIMATFIFILLWSLRKRIAAPGVLFSIYLVLNGVERFSIEMIRVNPHYHIMGFNISQAQLIALLLMIFGIAGLWFFTLRYQKVKRELSDKQNA